jgi:hypothetical protein
MGSETLAAQVEPLTGRARLAMFRYATDVVLGSLATNDFAASTSLATVQGYFKRVAAHARAVGARVWGVTVPPRCTGSFSSGAALPAASQAYYNSKFGPGSDAEQFNSWLAAGADGYVDGYFDLYAEYVDPSNAWKWRSDYIVSADGTHPTQLGHQNAGKSFASWARQAPRLVWA